MTPDTTLDAFRRAQTCFDAGQPAEAVRLLDEVVAASPGSTAALELRARALFASAQLGRAEQAFRELVARAPDDAWCRTALARTLERQAGDRKPLVSGASPRRSPADRPLAARAGRSSP